VAGCDKATPVAPSGTVLTISANPSQIALNGRSTVTVVGRKPDGNPLNPGTEIRLTAERGTIDSIVTTDSSGTATAVFHADSRAGAVKISAATGGGDAKADVSVQVGQASDQKPTVLLSVNPSTIPVNGSATVTVIGRNSDGSPATGQTVLLTSTLGKLGNTSLTTNASGTATTSLTAGTQAGTAKVTAVLGSSDTATADVEIKDAVLTLTADRTSIPEQTQTKITITATVTAFQGDPLPNRTVTFRADQGVLSDVTKVTDANGRAVVTLTVDAPQVTADQTFQVVASPPSGSGEPLTQTLNITIQNNKP